MDQVIDLVSSSSSSSDDSSVEDSEVMDPSNPKAHTPNVRVKKMVDLRQVKRSPPPPRLSVKSTPGKRLDTLDLKATSFVANIVDSVKKIRIETLKSEVQNITPSKINVISSPATVPAPKSAKKQQVTPQSLSKWGKKFLEPGREVAEIVEKPMEPLCDYILQDFKDRHATDPMQEEEEEEQDSSDEEPQRVLLGMIAAEQVADRTIEKDRKSTPKRASEPRYFRKDLSVKCFRCGEIGHMSGSCVNKRVGRPCVYCARVGHQPHSCPNMRCFTCFRPGHFAKDCPNRQRDLSFCEICGSNRHSDRDCHIGHDGFHGVHCMACDAQGHSCCITEPPIDRSFYCPNCAGDHDLRDCPKSLSNYGHGFSMYKERVAHASASKRRRSSPSSSRRSSTGSPPRHRNYRQNNNSTSPTISPRQSLIDSPTDFAQRRRIR